MGKAAVHRSTPTLPFSAKVVQTGLAAAERRCRSTGDKLTDGRRSVLQQILVSQEPIGAYDIMRRMHALGASTKPPTVYRALEFLEALGLIHRVDSLKAYVACTGLDHRHHAAFFICGRCGLTKEREVPVSRDALARAALEDGFVVTDVVQEVKGMCRNCAPVAA